MLPGQNYKELIEEHGQIQYRIADGLGYQINPTQYAPKKQKIKSNIKVINMETLKISVDVPVSKRLQNIEQQLLMMQNQRKLNLMTEQARVSSQKDEEKLQDQSPAVKMMHQLVEQYNFIVDHRHILQKSSEKARKILGIKKTTSQVINQQIEALRQRLATSSLADVIRINQQIATLYRRYQKNLFNSKEKSKISPSTYNDSIVIKKSSPVQKSRTNTSGISHILISSQFSPIKKISKAKSQAYDQQKLDSNNRQQNLIEIKDLKIMKQLNESEQAESRDNYKMDDVNQRDKEIFQPQSMILQNLIHKIKRRTSEFGGRRRVYTISDNKQKQRERKSQRMMTTISQSFANKQLIEKGKSLDKTLRQNQDVIQNWKDKVYLNYQKNTRIFIKYQTKPKRFKKSIKKLKTQQNYSSQKVEQEEPKSKQRDMTSRLAQIRQETAQKQRVLSIIIKKKQSKYKRIQGTKILHQVNANQIAKKFLGTAKRQKSRDSSRHNNSCIQNIVAPDNSTDVPEWMNIGYGHDQEFYWSMCRNQKLNLLLKHKKK